MTPSEKYGDEFFFDKLALRSGAGPNITIYQAAVGIRPAGDEGTTLTVAWQVARELAQWLITEFVAVAEETRFQIIVGWSPSVRKHQGQIFKIWGYKEGMQQIVFSESYCDYVLVSGLRAFRCLDGRRMFFLPFRPSRRSQQAPSFTQTDNASHVMIYDVLVQQIVA